MRAELSVGERRQCGKEKRRLSLEEGGEKRVGESKVGDMDKEVTRRRCSSKGGRHIHETAV